MNVMLHCYGKIRLNHILLDIKRSVGTGCHQTLKVEVIFAEMIRFQKPSPPLSLSLSSLAQVFLPYILLETLGILHVYLTLRSHQLTCALNVPPSSLNQQACTVGLQKADDILSPLFLQDPERYKAASPKIYQRLAALEALCPAILGGSAGLGPLPALLTTLSRPGSVLTTRPFPREAPSRAPLSLHLTLQLQVLLR